MASTANSFTTHQFDRFQLPGLNLPANWTPQGLFHTALSEVDIDNGSISLVFPFNTAAVRPGFNLFEVFG
jgi:hypothetical protein